MSSIISLFSGCPINKPMTIPGKLINLSLPLFYLVFQALLMAITASDFKKHQIKTGCNNLDFLFSEKNWFFYILNYHKYIIQITQNLIDKI